MLSSLFPVRLFLNIRALYSFVEIHFSAGGVSTLLNRGTFFLTGEILILNFSVIIFVV